MTRIAATIAYLHACQAARALGYPVSYTTDPAWLLNMAINRRAGWPDDPSHSRGSCHPVNGRYPTRAQGDEYSWLLRLARDMNGTRNIIRPGQVPLRYRGRLAHRLTVEPA